MKINPWSIEQYSDKDWNWKWDLIEKPSKNFLNTWKTEYNQNEVHKSSCYAHWPFTAITAITGYEFSLEERKKIVDECWTKDWADPTRWGKFQESVNFMCQYVNKNWILWKDQKLDYYRVPNRQWDEALAKWYLIVTGYIVEQWNRADRADDWEYNNSQWKYWKKYWWHCICLWRIDWKDYVIDNYKWRRDNNIVEWYESLEMYTNWYIFVIKEEWVRDWYEGLDLDWKLKKLSQRKEVLNRK